MDDKDVQIIRELLLAEDEYVSGSQLAELIGVSRVSIWSYMEKLKAQGFDFEAVRSKGYRMTGRPSILNQTLIQAQLTRKASAFTVFVHDEIDSTNSEAERLLAHGQEAPFVVIARKQTLGRGRLGRVWHSPSNGNVYSSFAFRPFVSPSHMSLFTLWMGLNLCECINSLYRIKCGVKWPNDIHIDGRKVAGILTEARMEADQVRDVILGIGLNANSDGSDWPEELKNVAISLSQATGETMDVNRLFAAITGRIAIAYQQFLDGAHKAIAKEKWPQFDTLRGKTISLMQGDNQISGVARGIDLTGSLIVERDDGSRFLARAGEVTLKKENEPSS
ncbi:biotin--[acetyl-CoA-carboxylase] ligase [Pelagicoccus sp. SDUM812003]|uniref:biotin--[acetyl-CoA-carboxylase] ligase n=1 Tax=Pelagicoccus sp. SDUM812003 TaxID=3041267 RepID=UPI00280E7D39|nr:biotin--[acetyl-CoA-carboxylase] ligase [Pelagicoccus sp. SDUM812003]MDQ8204814.1 biotin--[acetyl-CoA-carboxylase] ligase [Pelagicoccus sp. SDUM812003]